MQSFTVWVSEASGEGTIYINSCRATDVESAKEAVIGMCLEDWGDAYTRDDLVVRGVARGDVEIIEWFDPAEEF